MTSLVHFCYIWLRRNLSWSNSRQAWEERLGALILFAGIVAVWWSAHRLLLWKQAFVWSLLFLAVGLLLRRGWLKLLGPLFLYELVRAARRSRYVLLRLYVYFILLVFLVVFLAWWVNDRLTLTVPADQAAAVVKSFFLIFMIAQLVLVALVTPGYTAGAIAEEKDRRTLEALLATDLRDREIVLSKLAVRLANLALMLLTGLPILGMLQFLSGVDPDLVVAGLVVTGLTTASLASLAILNSVYARRSREAILYTYLEVAAYVLLSGLSQLVTTTFMATWTLGWGDLSVSIGDVIDWFGAGNPVVVLAKLAKSMAWGGVMTWSLPGMLGDYALFHSGCTVLFASWAALRLRAVFLKQASRRKPGSTVGRRRRPVGDWAMVWKEVFVETGLRFNWFGRILMNILLLASLVPGGLIEINTVGMSPTRVMEAMSYWARIVGAMVACLLLVGVAVRAATSISSERDRLTWDSLLTSPLSSSAILFAKWLGSMLNIRWGWLCLAAIWGLGSARGGFHILAVPLLLLACMVYAGLLAIVGLWFSLICQTSLRAIIWTLFAILALVAGFLVLPLYSSPFIQYTGRDASWVSWLYRFNMGMAPPLALGRMLPFGWNGPLPDIGRKPRWEMEFALLGLACWALAAGIIWVVTSMQFRRMTGRQIQRRPENQRLDRAVRGPVPSSVN